MKQRKEKKTKNNLINIAGPTTIAAMCVLLLGCAAAGPTPIRFGKDGCDHCKMTIMDQRFGGEIVTDKGKVYRFDDIRCIIEYIDAGKADKATSKVYFLDYNGEGNFIASDSAWLMKSEALRSPMAGNVVAFKDEQSRQQKMEAMGGSAVQWNDLLK